MIANLAGPDVFSLSLAPPGGSPGVTVLGARALPAVFTGMTRTEPKPITAMARTLPRYATTGVGAAVSRSTRAPGLASSPTDFLQNRDRGGLGGGSPLSPSAPQTTDVPVTPIATPDMPSAAMTDPATGIPVPMNPIPSGLTRTMSTSSPDGSALDHQSEFAVKLPTWGLVAAGAVVVGVGVFALSRMLPKK